MDYILLALVLIFSIKGFFKGFLSMFFSIFGLSTIIFLSWQFKETLIPFFSNLFGEGIQDCIKETLDNMISGEFSSIEELMSAISTSTIAKIFGTLLSKILGDITFEGALTAGEILSPTLTSLAIGAISFVSLFLMFYVLFKIVFLLLKKGMVALNFGAGNRLLGAVLGAVEGVILFAVTYFVLLTISNFILNEQLTAFLQSGQISTFLYEKVLLQAVEIFR